MVDYNLNMFIQAVCANCTNQKCLGALDESNRASCIKYHGWESLPAETQAKLFMQSIVSEITLTEDLIDD